MVLKKSKQRDAILDFLKPRTDHPTADFIYAEIRQTYPNISLGTVYRNLNLLADLGEIQRLHVDGGVDHYDGNPELHYHFICRKCGCVRDIPLDMNSKLDRAADEVFNGSIEGHITYFYGLCATCCNKA